MYQFCLAWCGKDVAIRNISTWGERSLLFWGTEVTHVHKSPRNLESAADGRWGWNNVMFLWTTFTYNQSAVLTVLSTEKRYASLVLDTKRYRAERELYWLSSGKSTPGEITALRLGVLKNAEGTMLGNCHVWEELQAFWTGIKEWLVWPPWAQVVDDSEALGVCSLLFRSGRSS